MWEWHSMPKCKLSTNTVRYRIRSFFLPNDSPRTYCTVLVSQASQSLLLQHASEGSWFSVPQEHGFLQSARSCRIDEESEVQLCYSSLRPNPVQTSWTFRAEQLLPKDSDRHIDAVVFENYGSQRMLWQPLRVALQ